MTTIRQSYALLTCISTERAQPYFLRAALICVLVIRLDLFSLACLMDKSGTIDYVPQRRRRLHGIPPAIRQSVREWVATLQTCGMRLLPAADVQGDQISVCTVVCHDLSQQSPHQSERWCTKSVLLLKTASSRYVQHCCRSVQ